MTASRKNTAILSEWVDPDDAPELTDVFFERAEIRESGKLMRRGRPALAHTKQPVTLRLDADVLAHFKSTGRGWQTRINEILRRAVRRRSASR